MTTTIDEVIFYDSEYMDHEGLKSSTIAVVGYGNLGSSMALNLRDAGLDVVVGNIDDDAKSRAETDGFQVLGIAEACADADLVYLLIPDEAIPARFDSDVAPSLRPGTAVAFGSGYCLAFGLVDVPEGIDVLMLAPRMLGEEVRSSTVDGTGFYSYCSVERDATGSAKARLLALATAAGALRRGALVLPAAKEALLDLMVEQTVGPYLGTAIQVAFAMGTSAGLPPEAMVLELYASGEMSRTFAAFADKGFYRSVNGHGAVATFGGFLRTLEMDTVAMRNHFSSVTDEIRSGSFARRLQDEQRNGYPTLRAIEAMTSGGDAMSAAEDRVRSWSEHR